MVLDRGAVVYFQPDIPVRVNTKNIFQEDPLEKRMATHSSILAWRIPWKKEPGRLEPMGSQRVGHE